MRKQLIILILTIGIIDIARAQTNMSTQCMNNIACNTSPGSSERSNLYTPESSMNPNSSLTSPNTSASEELDRASRNINSNTNEVTNQMPDYSNPANTENPSTPDNPSFNKDKTSPTLNSDLNAPAGGASDLPNSNINIGPPTNSNSINGSTLPPNNSYMNNNRTNSF